MASLNDERSIVVTIVQANELPFPTFRSKAFRPKAYVETIAGGIHRRTQSVKQEKKTYTRWDFKIDFSIPCRSLTTTFRVLRDSIYEDKCLGKCDINVEELLECQSQQVDGDVVLSLTDERGDPSAGRLTVRIAQQCLSDVAGDNVERAQTAAQKLSPPPIVNAIDGVTNLAGTGSNQMTLETSLGSLLGKVEILVKIGDEVAKIHPYVNFAWQVLSAGFNIVQAQRHRDQRILDLVTTMDDTYSLVVSADEMKKHSDLQDIVKRILKQTIECGYFIQEHARRNFGGRVITQAFSGMDDQIAAFCTAFNLLKQNFDSRVNLDTALVLSRTTVTIDAIRRDQLLSTLKSVEMQEYNRTICLNGTRLDVIKFIIDWIADESDDRKRVLWLNGLAGSGKSTTIALTMRDLHLLGAFFFFDRDIPERNAPTLIRTLAYQLALFDVSIGAEMSRIAESIPRIAEMPLDFQFTNLLSAQALKLVEWSGGPVVVVIDVLDECGNKTERKVLMQALSKGFSYLPSFMRVIVVSRPEADIEDTLSSHEAVQPYLLDIDSVATQEDISEFLRHRFSDIRRTMKHSQLGADWPSDDKIGSLTNSAGGLFVWASTACLYIESYDPDERLNELITQESNVDSCEPFVQLDRLYKTGLQSAGLWDNHSFRTDCCNVFGAILCARIPLSHSMIDSLLALPRSRSSLESISRLGCVLHISETEGIRTLHPSFHDYLSRRCSSEPWSIDLELHNERLARHCIQFLDNTLRENICGLTLPDPVQNESPSDAMSYACKFWVEHICLITHAANDIVELIYGFLGRHLLHWMEVLAVLKSHGNTTRSLQNLLDWLRKSPPMHTDLYQLVYDGHRFAQYFANTIEEHPLLLYISALPFAPANTSVYEKFYHKGLLKVICGVEKMWPRLLQLFHGDNGTVYSVAFSPDGSKIVSGSHDKTIRIWDVSTGVEMLPLLQGHDDSISSVAFSPDGSKIVSGSDDKTIRIWDASTGVETLPPLQGHDHYIRSVAFSPDGSKIVSGSVDKTIRIWDASTGVEMLPPLQGHDGLIYSVAFSPDGSRIVSGSRDKTIRIWDASTGVEMLPPLHGHNDDIYSVAFSPDGSKIVSGSGDNTIRIWDVSTGVEMLPPLQGHNGNIDSVAFSPDGSKIVSGSGDKTIQIWDVSTGVKMLPPLQGHDGYIFSVAFSPDGSKITSGSFDKTIRIWDASTGVEMPPPLQGHDYWVISVAFSSDGSKIVSGSYDKTIRIWDASTGVEMLPPLRGHDGYIYFVAFSPDGSKIVSGSDDKTIRIWDASTGVEILPPLQGYNDSISSVAFLPDGSKIVSGSWDKTIRIWDANTGVEMLSLLQDHDNSVNSVAFSPDGSKIFSRSNDDTIRVWDTSTGVEFLPSQPKADDDVLTSAPDCRIISFDKGWFTDSNTGHCLGRLPVDNSYYGWRAHRSGYVGWTREHTPVILQFP